VAVASAGPCKSFVPRSRQVTTPLPHHSVFTDSLRHDALPAAQPTNSVKALKARKKKKVQRKKTKGRRKDNDEDDDR